VQLFHMSSDRAQKASRVDPGFTSPTMAVRACMRSTIRPPGVAGVWNANWAFIGTLLHETGTERLWGQGGEPVFSNATWNPGTAVRVEGGFRIGGDRKIVSGVDHADWVIVLCRVTDGSAALADNLIQPGQNRYAGISVPSDREAAVVPWRG
jgi:alkylation response protein AidB-like acyl-CoA dehydrogenase